MRLLKILTSAMLLLGLPLAAQAICFVNQKAPGVHETTNPKTGEKYWTNSNGDYLCSSEEALPIDKIDQFVFFTGDKSSTNPYVHKEWDPERKTWVWKDNTGNFLGRDPDSITKEDLEWMAKEDPNWFLDNNLPWEVNDKLIDLIYEQQLTEALKQQVQEKQKSQTAQSQASKAKRDSTAAEEKLRQTDQQMAMTDAEVEQALAEIRKARAELQAAGASQYGAAYLDEAEAAIRQAQAASRQYKQQRGK